MINYAEVLLPLPLAGTFTYSIPMEIADRVKPGSRVVVPFGRKKFYTGIVVGITPIEPKGYTVKDILHALDDEAIVRHTQLKLWNWIADYYLCSPGEVYKAAVPAGLKVESETLLTPAPDFEEEADNRLSEREMLALNTLIGNERRMSTAELEKATGFASITTIVNRLLDKGAIVVSEHIVDKYRPRRETYVKLLAPTGDSAAIDEAFAKVKGARRQETALLAMVELTMDAERDATGRKEVTRRQLMERSGVTTSIVNELAKKGVIEVYKRDINRFDFGGHVTGELPRLTPAQAKALDEIHRSWTEKDVSLLHGVTSSGKTEIYIHLIDYVLKRGHQALMLVPEIALTTQLTGRLQRVFGSKVIIYHSKFSDNERVDIWRRMLSKTDPVVVIGARSAIFLPYADLKLVIVDEEHESSYKQMDPAPRYNGRDTALMLARMHSAKSLLGSATPAIDTYYKATNGRYGLIELTERYEGMRLPEMQLIDMSMARKRGMVKGIFSLTARDIVNEAVDSGRQAIIFLNRRGFAPVAQCSQCGWIPKCSTCDVSLTYHKRLNSLVCHYCGAKYPMPTVCPACKEPSIEIHGYGTERVEDEVAETFKGKGISRLDLDTTRGKDGYEKLINEFSSRKTSILVGTQMVTKGLDFAGVSAVAIVNADAMINYPDFRASERAFNMMEQVAGRAGRRDTPGTVAIQTYSPSHPIFEYLIAHNYKGFYEMELEERRMFSYPPFTRIIYVYLKHRDEHDLDIIAKAYAARLRELLGTRVHGPDIPRVARIQSLYIRRIMLKVEIEASMVKVKQLLRGLYEQMHQMPAMKAATVYYDVDPS